MVMGKLAVALHHQDVQAIVRIGEDLPIAALQQVVEHALAAAADLGGRYPLGEILLGVQFTQPADARQRIVQAGTGEAPGADRGADQRTLARYRRQPLTEQRQVQALDTQRFRSTGGAWQYADVLGPQATLADLAQGALAGLKVRAGYLMWMALMMGLVGNRRAL